MHTLIVVNPGHFHAALTLREMHPNLSKDVYVYAEEGADLKSFINLVRSSSLLRGECSNSSFPPSSSLPHT